MNPVRGARASGRGFPAAFTVAAVALLVLLHRAAFPAVHAEEAQVVPICEVLADPRLYDHRLLMISGNVSRGFEDFSLQSPACPHEAVWLEFGGRKRSQVIYCCGESTDPVRAHPLTVEGIETSLVEDDQLVKFDALTVRRVGSGHARATLTGWYFCGAPADPDGEKREPCGGYGHLGAFTLFIIQRVVSVSAK